MSKKGRVGVGGLLTAKLRHRCLPESDVFLRGLFLSVLQSCQGGEGV